MRRKITITLFIFFSAFMLNVAALAFQQGYERREDDEQGDPNAIEMTDLQVFKYLRNTWYFEFPFRENKAVEDKVFFVEEAGFGHQFTVITKPFRTCQLKFVLINYLGFFQRNLPEHTWILTTL